MVTGDQILRDAKRTLESVERSNPQLAGAESAAARQTNEAVVVDEDHGPLGNLIEGAAKRIAESWLGRKVGEALAYVSDRLDAASKKTGRVASGYVHSNAAEQDSVVRESKARAATALDAESARILQTNIGRSAEDVAADVAREGAERATREGAPVLAAAVVGRGLKLGEQIAGEFRTAERAAAGSAEHKAARWATYQERGGSWSYERWSAQYETNMRNPSVGLGREAVYREALGGQSRVIATPFGARQVDVMVPDARLLVQVKSGRQALTTTGRLANTLAIQKDAWLVKQGYSVEWVLEKGGSPQLLKALDAAGIGYHLGPVLK